MTPHLYLGQRASGKTRKLIEMAAQMEKMGELPYIVCRNHEEAWRIKKEADDMGLFVAFPITYGEFLDSVPGSSRMRLLVDNAMDLLAFISKTPIVAATVDITNVTYVNLDTDKREQDVHSTTL